MKNIALLLLVLALQSCAMSRAFVYWKPSVHQHPVFRHTEIVPGDEVFTFAQGDKSLFAGYTVDPGGFGQAGPEMSLEGYLESDRTLSFLIIRNDSILYEKYFNGHGPEDISCVFSVTKSVVSLLTGIAIDEGFIKSIDDPVTDYLPELSAKNPYFGQLTIAHLLNMESGIKFNEDGRSPFGKAAAFYYGKNLRRRIGKLKFVRPPGEVFDYHTANTTILGLALESATGRNLGEYFDEKVCKPLGMQNEIKWAIDDRRHNAAKGGVGLNMTAIDLAKIGRLYLNGGEWEGQRVVSREWIEETIAPRKYYHFSWYRPQFYVKNEDGGYFFTSKQHARSALDDFVNLDPDIKFGMIDESTEGWVARALPDSHAAIGIMSQVLFIDPAKNVIVVRLGEKWGEYPEIPYKITRGL